MKKDPAAIRTFLEQRKQLGLYRQARISRSPQQPRMMLDNRDYLVFCSNDYLGLANHPDIIRSFQKAASRFGVGSGAAHLINGHSIEHHKLEEELAEFTGRDRALLFSTGYMANLGVITVLMERGDRLYQDRLNHASLIDGGLLSRARMKRYPHDDTQKLAEWLAENDNGNQLIASDGVFSMDGDLAPVTSLARLAEKHHAWLMIDDAHGIGVLGQRGAGLLEQEKQTQADVPILMATLGKAFGTAGAFVAGSDELIDYLIQTARSYIYTTAMPPAIAAASRTSLELVQKENWRRDKLDKLIRYFKQCASQLDLPLMPSDTAIQPLLLGDTRIALKISNLLEQQGILASAIRPPTVPENSARLRITLSALHEQNDIDLLLDQLSAILLRTPLNSREDS